MVGADFLDPPETAMLELPHSERSSPKDNRTMFTALAPQVAPGPMCISHSTLAHTESRPTNDGARAKDAATACAVRRSA